MKSKTDITSNHKNDNTSVLIRVVMTPDLTDALLATFSAAGISSKAMVTTTLTEIITAVKADEQDTNDTLGDLDIDALMMPSREALKDTNPDNSLFGGNWVTSRRSDHTRNPTKKKDVNVMPTMKKYTINFNIRNFGGPSPRPSSMEKHLLMLLVTTCLPTWCDASLLVLAKPPTKSLATSTSPALLSSVTLCVKIPCSP